LADRDRDFKNILVIHFGQLGDVVLALPAMRAVRDRFSDARITALTGKVAGEVVNLTGCADEVIAVDRVELRDGPRLRSVSKILTLTRDLRHRDFDLVIDLHSLKETSILAWLTGAKDRLLADRGNRSYHNLGTFNMPAEDRSIPLSRAYMRVLAPLGLEMEPGHVSIKPAEDDRVYVIERIPSHAGQPCAGFFPGAGHPSRCWPLERFADLAKRLHDDGYAPVVFLGPEEQGMRDDVARAFPPETVVINGLSVPQFIAAAAEMTIFITNDTGPMHLAALAGSPILLIMDERAPLTYLPLASRIEVVNNADIEAISVADVHTAAKRILDRRPNDKDLGGVVISSSSPHRQQ
jgi:ADP-heptose:LPS heptosyltransferase